jgi:hypothetical protein
MPSYRPVRRDSDSGSECSDNSNHSRSTAPTVYSVGPTFKREDIAVVPTFYEDEQWELASRSSQERRYSVSSVESYSTIASTIASEAGVEEEYFYDEPELQYEHQASNVLASTPSEFAAHFPSTRRLHIHHDDTVDGNMNLRVDADAQIESGRNVDLTLFHLRMHDLKNREFSFRRHSRDSGREICHTSRKHIKPAVETRPGLPRSMSNAWTSLRSKSASKCSSISSFKRTDSGHASMHEDEEDSDGGFHIPKSSSATNLTLRTNTIQLEFSNYAHVDLKSRGLSASKHYDFEYWGTQYAWRRTVNKAGMSREVSYHLYNQKTNIAVAHIVPEPMTLAEAEIESAKGGWVPSCSMWISDDKIIAGLTDVAE